MLKKIGLLPIFALMSGCASLLHTNEGYDLAEDNTHEASIDPRAQYSPELIVSRYDKPYFVVVELYEHVDNLSKEFWQEAGADLALIGDAGSGSAVVLKQVDSKEECISEGTHLTTWLTTGWGGPRYTEPTRTVTCVNRDEIKSEFKTPFHLTASYI